MNTKNIIGMIEMKIYGVQNQNEDLGLSPSFIEIPFVSKESFFDNLQYYTIEELEENIFALRCCFFTELEPIELLFKYNKTNLAFIKSKLQ